MADWRNRSLCRGEDPELFFPVGTIGPALVQAEEAKAVCRRCDVTESCLQWAMETGQTAGIWGGLDEEERRALNRRSTMPPAPGKVAKLTAGPTGRPVGPAPACGSTPAYARHLRYGESVDDACKNANREAKAARCARSRTS